MLCTAWRLSAARYRFVPDWKLESIMKGMWNAVECHNGPFAPRFGRTCQSDGIQKIHRAVRAQAVIWALRPGNDDRLFANAVIEMRMFESSRPELRVVANPNSECRGSNPAAPASQSVSNASHMSRSRVWPSLIRLGWSFLCPPGSPARRRSGAAFGLST